MSSNVCLATISLYVVENFVGGVNGLVVFLHGLHSAGV